MARLSVDYYSPSLMRTTTLDVILPVDDHGEALGLDALRRSDPAAWERTPYPPQKAPFKTLYLLHGMSGNHRDFVSETRIRSWAESRGIAVVMPSGYNAFYLDQPSSFIGGISMGAYGALRNGFKYAENFGSIIALSSAMVINDIESIVTDDLFFLSRPFLESVFGPLDQVPDSDKDPRRLAADVVYCDRPRPRVYMAWGTQDPLAQANRLLAERLRGTGIDVTQEELPGGHDWEFWNTSLKRALDWLPLR